MERYERIVAQVIEKPMVYSTPTIVDEIIKGDIFKGESIIDSININKKIKKLIRILKNKDTSNFVIIRISDFFCHQLADYYKFSDDKLKIIRDNLFAAVFNGDDLLPPMRFRYFRFKNEKISYDVSYKLFENNIREKLEYLYYFQILNYILRSPYSEKENIRDQILDEFENLFTQEHISMYIKMQIADIFILNKRTKRGYEMLNSLREMEMELARINEIAERINTDNNTIYGDVQNVHDKNINESVLKAFIKLMTKYTVKEFNPREVKECLMKVNSNYEDIIDQVLERIEIDTSRFEYNLNAFSLHNAFSALWIYIQQHVNSKELHKRLLEEMISMARYCSTGHLSRFINVIQGFTDDDELKITIDNEQQIWAVLSNYFNNILMDAPDKVSDEMMNEGVRYHFFDFLRDCINKKIPELFKDYGDVKEEILSCVKKYSNYEYWKFENTTEKWKNYELKSFKLVWFEENYGGKGIPEKSKDTLAD